MSPCASTRPSCCEADAEEQNSQEGREQVTWQGQWRRGREAKTLRKESEGRTEGFEPGNVLLQRYRWLQEAEELRALGRGTAKTIRRHVVRDEDVAEPKITGSDEQAPRADQRCTTCRSPRHTISSPEDSRLSAHLRPDWKSNMMGFGVPPLSPENFTCSKVLVIRGCASNAV